MSFNVLVKLFTVSLIFSAVALTSGVSNAQMPTPTPDWVNIKDPKFGAMGNGSHDDTAAIQAAIDYAFAHNLTSIYCPAGSYKTTSTIYLDPPGNLRSNLSNPTNFGFSLAFFGDPGAAGRESTACKILPNFSNGIAFLVGPGQGMRVSDIAVLGPYGTHTGLQNPAGVGIGLAGGPGGSASNLIENTYVANFYTLYETDANNGCCLDDANTFRKVSGENGERCISFTAVNGQNYIDNVDSARLNCTVGIYNPLAKTISVWGGNIGGYGFSNAFTISGTSVLSGSPNNPYTFTTTISSPDAYVGTVYDSYTVVTAHFGVVPLIMTGYNSGTHVGTLKLYFDYSYGTVNLVTATDLSAEIQAATTLYAVERSYPFQGLGVHSIGNHFETVACTTAAYYYPASSGARQLILEDPYFNYDPALTQYAPVNNPNPANLAHFYCQQVFPFVGVEYGWPNSGVILKGGMYGQGGTTEAPLLFEAPIYDMLRGERLADLAPINMRVSLGGGTDSSVYAQNPLSYQLESVGRGLGRWDNTYWYAQGWRTIDGAQSSFLKGDLTTPNCGYEPCPWAEPNLRPDLFALVCPNANGGGSYGASYTCGALGALGSYPPIACRAVFKSVDWNTGSINAGIHKRSASCPGYSWGQNLTDAKVGETITWTYKGQSDTFYLSPKALSWLFPGSAFTITDSNGTNTYSVIEVHPQLGYIKVMRANANGGAPMAGTKTALYPCMSGCTIIQSPYMWTAY